MKKGSHRGLSLLLLGATAVLLVSIMLGNAIGGRVIGRIGTTLPIAVITPVPVTEPSVVATAQPDWRRVQVMVVATDPAFPDPRVTPPPPPPPTPLPPPPPPRPPRAPPRPQPTATPREFDPDDTGPERPSSRPPPSDSNSLPTPEPGTLH